MKFGQLGDSDLIVSKLGFGSQQIGGNKHGNSYGTTDDKVSARAIDTAVELGCNFFDTANVYGRGHSERLLGKTLRDSGKLYEVVIATKGGCNFQSHELYNDFSEEHIRRSVEDSLRRLNREYIDLYQLHNPTVDQIEDGAIWECLLSLRDSGKIRNIGVCVHSVEEAIVSSKLKFIVSIQIVYNFLSQMVRSDEQKRDMLDLGEIKRIGFIAREPLSNGFLSGKFKLDSVFESGDIRGELPREVREFRVRMATTVLAHVPSELTPTQFALKYVVEKPLFSTTIVGMKSAKQVRENFAILV